MDEKDNINDKQESPPVKKLGNPVSSNPTIHPEEQEEGKSASLGQDAYEKLLSEMYDNLAKTKEEILTKAEQMVNEVKEKMKPIETSEVNTGDNNKPRSDANTANNTTPQNTQKKPQIKDEISFEELLLTVWQWISAQWRNYLQSFLIVVSISFTALFGYFAIKFQKDNVQLLAEKHRIELIDEKYRTLRHWAEHDRNWRKRFLMIDQMYSDTIYYRDDIRDLQSHISRLDSINASK